MWADHRRVDEWWLVHVKLWYRRTPFENEDDRRLARVLGWLVLASFVVYLLVALMSWSFDYWKTISVMGAAIVLQMIPL
jgi:hypothetical protein